MSEKQAISVSQLAIYNPQRISDEVMMQVFIARKKIFNLLIRKIRQEKPNSIPQHHLVIALRGMGKSTLLKRIEVELRQTPYKKNFIPLLYPEEQYNLSNLAEFWLNSLDALADTLEVEKDNTIYLEIDQQIQQLNKISDATQLAKKAHAYFLEVAAKMSRRPVLLVDNLNLIFNRLSKAEQHTLRAWLMQNKAPILMGASAVSIEDTHNYGMPFYDAFQQHYLQKLTFEESVEILKELATLTHSEAILPSIHQEVGRLKTIHHLTGGNPRTSVMLFRLIAKGFSKELNDDLEALLDEITPLYKARFEALSDSQQKIVDAIALNWDPINLGDLRSATRLENNQISPQLKRLKEVGWIESLDAYQAKGKAYQISERFFNIWFLMRRSSRRQKRELLCLSKFLETFYGERLTGIAEGRLGLEAVTANHVAFNLAIVEVLKNEELKVKLRKKSYEDLERLAKTNPNILEQFESKEFNLFKRKKLFNKFKYYSENEEYQNALKSLEELALVWNNYNIFHFKGNLLFLYLNKFKEAEFAYLKSIELNPNDASTWNNLGYLYKRELKKYDKAEEAYLKAIELEEDNASFWNNLGNLYQVYLNQYDKAEEAYLKAIELEENNASFWNHLGDLYQEHLNEYNKAKKAYLKAIELEENNASFWDNLGNLYQEHLNEYNKAKKAYLKAIELEENNASFWNHLGSLYQEHLHQYDKAEKTYLKAMTFSDDPKILSLIWAGLAILYHENLKKYKKAVNAYLKAIEMGFETKEGWALLGAIYFTHLKEYKKAEGAFLKAIKLESNFFLPKIYLLNLYRDVFGKFEKAKKVFNELDFDKALRPSFYLHKVIFDLYESNKGIATKEFKKALNLISEQTLYEYEDDWVYFLAITTKLGYNQWLQDNLKEQGYDIILAPYFVAIKALNEKDEAGYLNSKAVEIREPAKKIIEMLRQYMD